MRTGLLPEPLRVGRFNRPHPERRPTGTESACVLSKGEEVRLIRHDVQLAPLATWVNHFKYADLMKVYEAATPEEKKQLDLLRLRKRHALLEKGKRAEVAEAESR